MKLWEVELVQSQAELCGIETRVIVVDEVSYSIVINKKVYSTKTYALCALSSVLIKRNK